MTLPTYDTHHTPRSPSNAPRLTVTVVSSIEDLWKVFSIRAATYMAEQYCPYREEFDGNDFCAAHFLGFVDEEPAACARMRFFSDFVKLERIAVRQEFRNTRLLFHLARAAMDFARKKGFREMYGHPTDRMYKFWQKLGGQPIEGERKVVFSDVQYREIRVPLKPDPDAIGTHTDPYVLLRPEGQWHRRGVLEESASRPVISR